MQEIIPLPPAVTDTLESYMFNPMTPAEVMRAVGRVARDVAKGDEGLSQFTRVQLLSSFSACRHIAVEVEAYPEVMRDFLMQLRSALNEYVSGSRRVSATMGRLLELDGSVDSRRLGALTCELLEQLRGQDDEEAMRLRRRIRLLLSELVDSEVTLLARAIEGDASSG